MAKFRIDDVKKYVEDNVGSFHSKRLNCLEQLKLNKILKRKNPYLYKAKNILTAQDLLKNLLDAHLLSQEETLFGDFLEGLAIFINEKIYLGWKSSTEGIDLEFDNKGIRYIVSIKSGPNWGNSGQVRRMVDDFKRAKKILRKNNPDLNVIPINGCCYGVDNNPDKGDYLKYCGQQFWHFISGIDNLYTDIIEPLGHRAKEKNDEFNDSYAQILNKFTLEFINNFCEDGIINWKRLVQFNSSKEKLFHTN